MGYGAWLRVSSKIEHLEPDQRRQGAEEVRQGHRWCGTIVSVVQVGHLVVLTRQTVDHDEIDVAAVANSLRNSGCGEMVFEDDAMPAHRPALDNMNGVSRSKIHRVTPLQFFKGGENAWITSQGRDVEIGRRFVER